MLPGGWSYLFRIKLINFCHNHFSEISIKLHCYFMYTLTDESHKSVTNSQFLTFLDVTLDLTNGKYMTYTKANNPSLRSQEIKHLWIVPRIIGNIPQSINKRLSEISYMMKNHSSKTHLSIRKPLMTADINTY